MRRSNIGLSREALGLLGRERGRQKERKQVDVVHGRGTARRMPKFRSRLSVRPKGFYTAANSAVYQGFPDMVKVIADWLILAVLSAALFFLASYAFGSGQWESRLLESKDGQVYTATVPEWAMTVYLYEDDAYYAVYDLNGATPFNPAATYYNCPRWAYPPRKRDR